MGLQVILNDALNKLKQISHIQHCLVSKCTLSLVISEDAALNFSSSTHGLYIGRVTIGARNCSEISVASIMDALVHESIHCLLLMFDRTHPLLKDDLQADTLPPIISPWTGTPLPVPTYVHAVMVWFGLVHLWSRALVTSQFPAELSETMVHRASRGFKACDVVVSMSSEARKLLSEHTIVSLETMQREVQELLR